MKLQIRLHNSDYFILIFGVCLSIASLEECCGKIIFPPTNKVALEGSEVLMECRTDSSGQILWRKIDNPSKLTATKNVYSGTKFTDNFSHFRINTTSPGQYDLLFTAAMTVAGQYLCHEPGGEKVYSQLIVLASNSTCSIKEETNFNSTMECRVRFSGHWFPEMEWEEEYSGERRNDSHTIDRSAISEISSQSIVTKLTVNRQHFQRKFTCITKFKAGARPASTTAQNIPDYEYKCVVFTNASQNEITSTASHDVSTNSTEVSTLSYTGDYAKVNNLALVIGLGVLFCVLLLVLFIFFLFRKKQQIEQCSQSPVTSDPVDNVNFNAANCLNAGNDGTEYAQMNDFRGKQRNVPPPQPSRYETTIYAAIDHTCSHPKLID